MTLNFASNEYGVYKYYPPVNLPNPTMCSAIVVRDCESIINMLSNDYNMTDLHSILQYAVICDNIQIIDSISSMFDVDFNFQDNSLLRTAIFHEKINSIKYLLKFNIDIDLNDGIAIKTYCVNSTSSLEILELLIDHGANIHIDNEYPMRASIYHKKKDRVRLLLKHGGKIPILLTDDTLEPVINIQDIEMIKILLEHEVKFESYSIRQQIIFTQNFDIIKLFLDHKIKIDIDAALTHSAIYNNIELVTLLLDCNANVQNSAALKIATASQNCDIVTLLLNHGASWSGIFNNVLYENPPLMKMIDFLEEQGLNARQIILLLSPSIVRL